MSGRTPPADPDRPGLLRLAPAADPPDPPGGDLPEPPDIADLRIELPSLPYLRDHVVEGRPVLPAVEAVELLAGAVQRVAPGIELRCSRQASFLRFLDCGPGSRHELSVLIVGPAEAGRGVQATLGSRSEAGRSGLARTVEHVRILFGPWPAGEIALPSPGPDERPAPPHFSCPADRLYAELVPFGPAFRNACGTVLLGRDGAAAAVQAPEVAQPGLPGAAPTRLLGSPFPLDAAFHVACAWGQRALGRVLFPTGYGLRLVHRPIAPGERLRCQVRVRGQAAADRASFDIWLFGEDGLLCEEARGVQMQDIFRGRREPPAWLLAPPSGTGSDG